MLSWLDVFKHLLPNARAWRITVDKTLRQFFQGLTGLPSDVRDYLDQIFNDVDPQLTRELAAWETQFALADTGMTTQDRRDRLAAAWKALGGQSPRYIQDTLQAAGFDVFIHEWWNLIVQPVLDIPLERNLNLLRGTGPATFTRADTATYLDPASGLVKTAAVDVARFEADGLLHEGPSTNYIDRSEETDNAAWVKTNLTISPDAVTAPDGNVTADKLVETAVNGTHRIANTAPIPAGPITGYIFVGPAERQFIRLFLFNGTDGTLVSTFFDVSAGTVVSGVGIITPVANGFFKCEVSAVATVANSTLFLGLSADGVGDSYLGDITKGLYAWGAQVEPLPFGTSYIPTLGAAVPRSPDVLTVPFAGNMQDISNPYTIRVEAKRLGHTGISSQPLWDIGDGGGLEAQLAWWEGDPNTLLSYYDGINRATTEATPESSHRYTQSYDGTSVAVHIDGVLKRTDPAVSGFVGVYEAIHIGTNIPLSRQLYGHLKNFQIYDRNLTTAQLAEPEPPILPGDPPVARDPFLYLDDGTTPLPFLAADGALDMQDGDGIAMDGATQTPVGYPLVNKLLEATDSFIGDGAAAMQDGGQNAQDGDALTIYSLKQYVIPADPTKYPFFLYLGGEDFPDVANVSQSRRDEFEDLCLKICPTEQWLGILVNYS